MKVTKVMGLYLRVMFCFFIFLVVQDHLNCTQHRMAAKLWNNALELGYIYKKKSCFRFHRVFLMTFFAVALGNIFIFFSTAFLKIFMQVDFQYFWSTDFFFYDQKPLMTNKTTENQSCEINLHRTIARWDFLPSLFECQKFIICELSLLT